MKIKKIVGLTITTLVLGIFTIDASAESIRLRCETRGTARSKISVDGRGFVNSLTYRTRVASGGVTVLSKLPMKHPVGGEIEFDFDSDGGDIRAGATGIKAGYIKKSQVVASIIDRDGYKVTESDACSTKKK
jgi:hypothetical protein